MEEAFYQVPTFWVFISFLVFLSLAFRPLAKAFTRVLDARSAEIASELEEARRLRAEAQAMLDAYRAKQQDSLQEAEAMLARAKQDAQALADKAEADLKAALDKRMKLASDRIAQAETQALLEVKTHVVDIALAAARTLITEHLARSGSQELTQQAAAELQRKLH